MSQAGYTPIQLYYSTTASTAPSAGNLANGELAINITDGKLFYKDNGGNVQVLATKGAGTIGGSNTQVQYNSSGALAGSANLTFDGTTLSANALTVANAVTLSGGTANGVPYLNGSKVLTTGSALTFNGSTLGVLGSGLVQTFTSTGDFSTTGTAYLRWYDSVGAKGYIGYAGTASTLTLASSMSGLDLQSNTYVTFSTPTEQMRLTSTGLGIGTSSPNSYAKLTLEKSGGDSAIAMVKTGGAQTAYLATDGANAWIGSSFGSTGKKFFISLTAPDSAATIDSSGNLGLGVTPSAWTFRKAMQLGLGASIAGGASAAALVEVGANTYLNGSAQDIYIANGYATRYQQFNGNHYWQIASSGTAGNPISFTQAMTLDASGNLQIKPGNIYTDTTSGIFFSGTIGSFTNGIYGIGTNNVAINTAGSERARIDTSGNLLVGLTGSQFSSSSKLRVFNSGAIAGDFRVSGGNSIYVTTMWNDDTTGNNSFTAFATEAGGTIRGSITYNRLGGLTAYNTTSDYRAKDIIGPVINSGELIDSVPVYMGKMHGATQERPMFIAHETPVYAHTGEKDAVDADGNPVFQQMDASALIPVMWAEIQSLRKRLAAAGI